MKFDTTDDCICGGTASLPAPGRADDDLLSSVPCHACIARWDTTHCARCERRFEPDEGRCAVEGERLLCEPCMALRPSVVEDYRALVERRRVAILAAKAAGVEFERCRREFDREGHPKAVAALRSTAQEARDALAAIDGTS